MQDPSDGKGYPFDLIAQYGLKDNVEWLAALSRETRVTATSGTGTSGAPSSGPGRNLHPL
jgi:hypothetical protein